MKRSSCVVVFMIFPQIYLIPFALSLSKGEHSSFDKLSTNGYLKLEVTFLFA